MLMSHRADYAIRAMRFLSSLPKGAVGSINEVAVGESIPREFLAKILKDLTTARLLTSHLGVNGGYRLAKRSQEISLLDVIEAVDGPVHLNLCTEADGDYCTQAADCPMHSFWIAQEKSIKGSLASQKLSRFTKRPA